MPIKHAIWTVGDQRTPLPITRLATEQLLEDMIENDPRILSEQWMLIGRQEHTPTGGRIDLLAIGPGRLACPNRTQARQSPARHRGSSHRSCKKRRLPPRVRRRPRESRILRQNQLARSHPRRESLPRSRLLRQSKLRLQTPNPKMAQDDRPPQRVFHEVGSINT